MPQDILIVGCALLVLSIISDYFWWLALAIPAYALYMLWTNVLGPWFFQGSGPQLPMPDDADKKKKKKKRKVIRGPR